MAITTKQMECCIASYFGTRANIIVPCVSWGWIAGHECDLVVVTKARYAYEVEIKISSGDLRADFKKEHGHVSKAIKRLYYAIPIEMIKHAHLIPDYCGIIIVAQGDAGYSALKDKDITRDTKFLKFCGWSIEKPGERMYAKKIREARNKSNVKLNDSQVLALTRLGLLRYWSQRGVT